MAVMVAPVELMVRDDASARLRALVDQHFDFIWRSVRRLGVREGDADDAAQKVFLIAAGKLDEIEPGSEKAFLFATALRVASHARRSYRACREESDLDPDLWEGKTPSADALLDQRRARLLVDRVLEAMPEELRAVLVLHEVEELTTPEIAQMIGVPLGTAASRLRRAREQFEAKVHSLGLRSSAAGGVP